MQNKYYEKALKILKIILAFIIVVVILLGTFQITGLQRHFFGGDILKVITPSMEPTFSVNDYLIYRSIHVDDIDDINVDDIVLFISSSGDTAGMLIAHRVQSKYVDEEGNIFFVTSGDANPIDDVQPVKSNFVRGVIVEKSNMLTFMGKIFTFNVIMFVIVAFLLAFMIFQVLMIVNKIKINREVKTAILNAGLDPTDPKLLELVQQYGVEIIQNITKK